MWHLLKKIKNTHREDNKLIAVLRTILGYSPSNLALYRLATTHNSKAKTVNGFKESNERLEFLGDAILGAIVTDYIFKKYPLKSEGFLTEIRSRIVNRDSLNRLGHRLGIINILQYDSKNTTIQSKVLGNALEAIIGAVYLDKGYLQCKKFVLDKLLQPYYDLQVIANSTTNYKSKIIEWAQKNNLTIRFEVGELKDNLPEKGFIAEVFLGDCPYGKGIGYTKKKAMQEAAEKTHLILGIE